ncbi:RNA-binding protein [Candidatus Saccharibacteria bacterium]|nr:RNA-binding protein [Candidatus Saccharibacteria bacterium]
MKLFVGSLPFSTTDDELRELFSAHGTVDSARVMTDRETNRSRGFGFVEMGNDDEAKKAIEALNNSDIGGRNIVVNEARPREDRPRRDFNGGGGYDRNGGGNGGSFRQRSW